MDERFFMPPYYYTMPYLNFSPNIHATNNALNSSNFPKDFSPKDFYESGYYYYRYLNEMLDYELKSKEVYKNNQNINTNTNTAQNFQKNNN